MANRKNVFVCPDIDCFVTALQRRQLGHGMDYYKGRSSMSGYGLGSWFAKLFRSAIPLAKKYIAPVAADFASSTLHDWGDGKDFKESVSKNLRSSARSLGERLKQSGKGFKRRRNISSLISLYSGQKRKTSSSSSLLSKKSKKKKPRRKIVRSKRDFFS
jgi:hypothetical protein